MKLKERIALACPISIFLVSNAFCACSHKFNNLRMFDTVVLDFPTASAASSWVILNSSIKRFMPLASSITFKSSR